MRLQTGRKGKIFNDRELAAKVRTLTLEKIEKILKGKQNAFQKALLLKLAGSILPRLQEHSGPDGKPIPILNVLDENNYGRQENIETHPEE